MASQFERDMAEESQRRDQAAKKQHDFDAAHAAIRQGLIDKVIGAAHEFRDTMVAHNIPPQPLSIPGLDSEPHANRKNRGKLATQWAAPPQHRGWGFLSIHMWGPEENQAGDPHWVVDATPFVTTDGLILDAFIPLNDNESRRLATPPSLDELMTRPAMLGLTGLSDDRRDIRKQPIQLAEAQQAYIQQAFSGIPQQGEVVTHPGAVVDYQNDEYRARFLAYYQQETARTAEAVRARLIGSALQWLQHSPK